MSKETLKKLARLPENYNCVDCGFSPTTWCSINLSVFLCLNCSGAHRSLGTHITQIRSLDLDKWTSSMVDGMSKTNNVLFNRNYECKIQNKTAKCEKLTPLATDSVRFQYIKDKYERRLFYGEPQNASANALNPGNLSPRSFRRAQRRGLLNDSTSLSNAPSTASQSQNVDFFDLSSSHTPDNASVSGSSIGSKTNEVGDKPSLGLFSGLTLTRSNTHTNTNSKGDVFDSGIFNIPPSLSHSASLSTPHGPATPMPTPNPQSSVSNDLSFDLFGSLSNPAPNTPNTNSNSAKPSFVPKSTGLKPFKPQPVTKTLSNTNTQNNLFNNMAAKPSNVQPKTAFVSQTLIDVDEHGKKVMKKKTFADNYTGMTSNNLPPTSVTSSTSNAHVTNNHVEHDVFANLTVIEPTDNVDIPISSVDEGTHDNENENAFDFIGDDGDDDDIDVFADLVSQNDPEPEVSLCPTSVSPVSMVHTSSMNNSIEGDMQVENQVSHDVFDNMTYSLNNSLDQLNSNEDDASSSAFDFMNNDEQNHLTNNDNVGISDGKSNLNDVAVVEDEDSIWSGGLFDD